jgi:hypothetical protein
LCNSNIGKIAALDQRRESYVIGDESIATANVEARFETRERTVREPPVRQNLILVGAVREPPFLVSAAP